MPSGFFLGGVAEGLSEAEKSRLERDRLSTDTALRTRGLDITETGQKADIGLRERAQKLAERNSARTAGRDAIATADKQFSEYMGLVSKVVEAGIAAGTDPATVQAKIAPLVDIAKQIAPRAGRNPAVIDAQISTLFGGPSMVESATAKGTAEGTAEAAKRKALSASGVSLVNKDTLTPAQLAADKKFGEEYTEFVASGGYADVDKSLRQLDPVLNALEGKDAKGNKLPGGTPRLSGPVTGSLPDAVNAAVNPDAISTREMVEEVAQRNLRAVLGGQFSQKEGEQLIRRAYNPLLPEKDNAKRLRNLVTQVRTAAQQKQRASEYYEKHGTLVGFKGKLPSFGDMSSGVEPVTITTPGGSRFTVKN